MGLDSPDATGVEAMEAFKRHLLHSIKKVDFGYVRKWRIDPLRGALVTVQPSRLLRDEATGRTEERAPIPDVPVIFMGAGDYVVAGELQKDQPVILLIADHQLAGWLEGKRLVAPPKIEAPHSVAGALALPLQGLGPLSMAGLGKGLTLGKRDGSVRIQLSEVLGIPTVSVNGAVVKLGDGAVLPAAMGGALVGALITYCAAVAATPTTVGIVAATAILATALAIPPGTPGSPLSAKTLVE